MQEKIIKKMMLGFIQIHILHHAKKEPFYGSFMLQELQEHGYSFSAGTLYPILHAMEKQELISCETKTIDKKRRKYYSITKDGEALLEIAKDKAKELFHELINE